MNKIVLIGVGLTALGAVHAQAGSTIVSVDSHAAPWEFVDGGLNTGFKYGVQDTIAPVVIQAGFDFTPGTSFTITYLDGLTSAFGGPPVVDAIGHLFYTTDANPGSSGQVFPSFYFDPGDYPSYLNSLVGTFADDTGAVVGTPFNVALGRTVTAPAGATRLQLGINDDIFFDNTGSLRVQVTTPGVPDAGSSLALLGLSGFGLAVFSRRSTRN